MNIRCQELFIDQNKIENKIIEFAKNHITANQLVSESMLFDTLTTNINYIKNSVRSKLICDGYEVSNITTHEVYWSKSC